MTQTLQGSECPLQRVLPRKNSSYGQPPSLNGFIARWDAIGFANFSGYFLRGITTNSPPLKRDRLFRSSWQWIFSPYQSTKHLGFLTKTPGKWFTNLQFKSVRTCFETQSPSGGCGTGQRWMDSPIHRFYGVFCLGVVWRVRNFPQLKHGVS